MLSKTERQHIYRQSRKIPLLKYCELCPEENRELAVQRHHLNYEYPEIFLSLCLECHRSVENDKTGCISANKRPISRSGRVIEMKSIRQCKKYVALREIVRN